MQEVVMQTAESYSVREATDRVVKIIDSTYEKDDLDKVATAAFQLDKYHRKHLLSIITIIEEFFDKTLGKRDTNTSELEVNPGSKVINDRYYPVPNINKETLRKLLITTKIDRK